MVEIATQYHNNLQDEYQDNLDDCERMNATRESLSRVTRKLASHQINYLQQNLTYNEIRRALFEVPNGKAAGLDGIPVEVWKFLQLAHEGKAKGINENNAPVDFVSVLV